MSARVVASSRAVRRCISCGPELIFLPPAATAFVTSLTPCVAASATARRWGLSSRCCALMNSCTLRVALVQRLSRRDLAQYTAHAAVLAIPANHTSFDPDLASATMFAVITGSPPPLYGG